MSATVTRNSLEQELAVDMAGFQQDPLGWVLYSFEWGKGTLKDRKIEVWQERVLNNLGKALRKGSVKDAAGAWKYVGEAIRIARRSGHGIGKSALIAWIILWAMSTFPDTRGVVTANTFVQLSTKTWPELQKWYSLCIVRHWFTITATSLFARQKGHEKTWRFDAIPWSENNTEAFAGLHNQGKRIVLIFDEASAIADAIWEVAEGAMTDQETEIIWLAFGNPTRNTGRFHDCFNSQRHRWDQDSIDSRTVSITDKKQISQWEVDHGTDSDFFRVRVRGVEPNASADQFIGADIVEAARGRELKKDAFHFAAIIIGVDPKYSGTDEFVIWKRQGLASWKLGVYTEGTDDDAKMAGIIARLEDEHKADAVVIDFGYGTGIHSAGRQMNRTWHLAKFGGASPDPMYLNLRAFMWGTMRQWLKDGGCIPDDEVLCAELKAPEGYVVATGANAGKIYLESKDDMKARGVTSPNRADALATTFAVPVQPKRSGLPQGRGANRNHQSEYDPHERAEQEAA